MPALSRQRSVVCLVGPSLLAALVAGLPLSERRDSSFLGSRRTTGDEAERGPFWVPCFNFPRVAPSGEEDHVLGTFHPSKIHHGSDGGAQSGFSLRVSPTRLGAAGGDVSVQWSAPALHAPLWIGAFLANDNITETAPLKFALITRFARGNALRFSLPNMRDDFVFALFEGGVTRVSEASGQPNSRIHAKDWEDSDVLLNGGPATLVATSPLVRVAGRHQPTGVHIALTGVAGEMLVSWTTGNAAPRQVVQIRRQGGEIEEVAVDPATSYNRADMCGPPATSAGFRPPGHLQHARIVGIPAAAMVTYRVGSDAGGWSPWRDFRAPPANGAVTHALKPEGVSFVAFGDLGQFSADDATQLCQCPASRRTTDGILASVAATDFVLHVGDISYARGYASEWDFFMQQIEPIAARIPWMTSIGNHERDWPASGSVVGLTDSGGECGVAYRARFPMPPPTNTSGEPQGPKFRRVSRGAASDDSPWYSFDWGPVHILVYSTEHAIQAQLPFMRSDLARVDRTATPWIIVAVSPQSGTALASATNSL